MHTFITVPEAAELVGVTVHAIRSAVQRGDIVGGKLGGRYIVSRESAQAYQPREYTRNGDKETPPETRPERAD